MIESNILFLKNHATITVSSNDLVPVAQLVPVNARAIHQYDNVCELMSRWRNQFRESFLTQFTATPERTFHWLHNEVIARNDKILFLIIVNGEVVGHIGLTDITADNAEIDNVVNTHRKKDFFYEVLRVVVQMCFDLMSIKKITIQYLSNNEIAVRAYRKIFHEAPVRSEPVRKIQDGDTIKYVICEPQNANVDIMYLTSELTTPHFQ
jgi:Acetyltransferases, including N-acetylases of ribosomal proteins